MVFRAIVYTYRLTPFQVPPIGLPSEIQGQPSFSLLPQTTPGYCLRLTNYSERHK